MFQAGSSRSHEDPDQGVPAVARSIGARAKAGDNTFLMRKCTFVAAAFTVAVCVLLGACAAKLVPAPVVTTPKFPDFVRPIVPPEFANSPAAARHARGWAFLESGDLRTAEREFAAALALAPAFHPAQASLGYVELARSDAKAALPHFDRALEQQAGNVAALVGRGDALVALNRQGDALVAFDAALAADGSLTDIRRRVEVLRFRGVEQGLARGRAAASGGRLDEARAAYTAAISSSPDSPFLYRELAGVERQQGDVDAALEHLRKAVALDAGDTKSLGQIGEILESRFDFDGAEQAYVSALALEPSADIEKRLGDVRARVALSRLPPEYRAISQKAQLTRAELAALIGIRLGSLLQTARRGGAALITDVRGHWAATWIMAVASAGVVEPFANHAFQPRTVVRRTDLAQAVAHLLTRVGARANAWESARLKFSDLSPTHLAYRAASVAVASGVMTPGDGNSFQPSRPVSGAEAIDAIGRIEVLARP